MSPSGDQPEAIAALEANLNSGVNRQVLLGVTGSGKTFTVANLIQKTQLPTLVISHNKTLAGQLYQEFKELFPNNKVSYFVSYYDYYQPEAYIPASDTYIAKEVEINDLIDKLRLEATSNLFSGKDNIVIASVSCIYNIGDPREFGSRVINFQIGHVYPRRSLLEQLITLFYQRSDLEFKRGTFRLRGDNLEIWPSYADWILDITFSPTEELVAITQRHPFTAQEFTLTSYQLFPAKQYVGAQGEVLKSIIPQIKADARKQSEVFKSQGRLLEAQRIVQRVDYDMEMLEELGYVNGIENYSIYFEDRRHPGDPPFTLLDYFNELYPDGFLTVIDESHVTVPQVRGMFNGDLARKTNLIDFGFRLPAALDNRPLTWDEFNQRLSKVVYVSATPADFELEDSKKSYLSNVPEHQRTSGLGVVEQIIRPTGLVDPPATVRPTKNQIPDLISEIKLRAERGERTLVVTLTKKMAEELAQYLSEPSKVGFPLRVTYLHADINTLERTEILEKLRGGEYEVLIGVNLLREGLDLPEVSLVAIMDADQQGFLRSRSSLIQIMGRAARHVNGQIILYADRVSDAMSQAMAEIDRRRQKQTAYNLKHNITPQSIIKAIRPKIIELEAKKDPTLSPLVNVEPDSLTPPQRKHYLTQMRKAMKQAAIDLNFEEAIRLRDKIKEIETL